VEGRETPCLERQLWKAWNAGDDPPGNPRGVVVVVECPLAISAPTPNAAPTMNTNAMRPAIT